MAHLGLGRFVPSRELVRRCLNYLARGENREEDGGTLALRLQGTSLLMI